MAEKRRGLGRGLGSLIPSQETGRPSDVFFPRGQRSGDAAVDAPADEQKDARSTDPAESMRRAQASRKTGTAKRATGTSTSAAGAKTPAAKTAASKSAASKASASKSPAAKSSAAKSSTAKASATKAPAAKTAAPKATSSKSASSQSAASTATASTTATSNTAASKSTASKSAASKRTGAKAAETTRTAASSMDPIDTDANIQEQEPVNNVKSESSSIDDSKSAAAVPLDSTATGSAADAAEFDDVDVTRDGVFVSRETVTTQRSHAVDGQSDTSVENMIEEDVVDVTTDLRDASEADAFESDLEDDPELPDLVPVPGATFGEIELDLIRPNPRQPREVFDEDALDELITSIREIGVLQPVVVRRRPDLAGHYELIMGERRYRASKEAGRTTIPAIVRTTTDDDLLRDALLENLHRVDLNPLEEAAAYAQLLEDFQCTQEELSERIGRSRPQISNTIRLLKLPAMVQRRVAAGVLSSGHARALLGLNDGADMEQLAQRVVAEGLSVRATEEAVILLNRGDRMTVSRGTRQADPELAALARNLGDRLDTRVNVVMGKRKGKLSVEFANGEDLARILGLLGLEATHSDD